MSYVGGAEQINLTTSTSCVITHGLTIQSGDVIVLASMEGGSGTGTATYPAGFSHPSGNITFSSANVGGGNATSDLKVKIAGGSEPSSYTVTYDQNDFHALQIRVYRGRNTSSPYSYLVQMAAVNNTGNPITFATSALTAAAGDDVVVISCVNGLGGATQALTFTPPAGFANGLTGNPTVSFSQTFTGMDDVGVAGGSTGTIAGTLSNSLAANSSYVTYALSLAALAATSYRGGATATYAAGTSSFAINVASIGIQPGDIVTLWIAGNFTASDPLYNFPGGFGPVKGLVNRSASGTAWLGVAYKIAGIEPTTYTITSGSASVTFTSAVQCRVYSGRSGFITGTNYLGSSGSAPPVTFQLAGISGNVNDVIVACTMTVPNNTNGTQTLTPSAGFGNALVSTAASVQCTAIAGQDYVSFPGGSTGTIGGVFADTGGESNIHYLGFVMGLGITGGSTPPSGPMPRQLYIMP